MLILLYESKKKLKEKVGNYLKFRDPSIFSSDFNNNGVVYGSNRPYLTGYKREFYANVTLKNGVITKVN